MGNKTQVMDGNSGHGQRFHGALISLTRLNPIYTIIFRTTAGTDYPFDKCSEPP